MRISKYFIKRTITALAFMFVLGATIGIGTAKVSAGPVRCFAPNDSGGYQAFDCNLLAQLDPATLAQINTVAQSKTEETCFKLRVSGAGIGGPAEELSCATATGEKPPECYKGEFVRTPEKDTHVFRQDYCSEAYKSNLGGSFVPNKCYLLEYDKSHKVAYKGETTCGQEMIDRVKKDSGITGDVVTDGGAGAPQNPAPTPTPTPGTVNPGSVTSCNSSNPNFKPNFFALPTWYEFLPPGDNCSIDIKLDSAPNTIWLIALAIADILLRVAGLIAVLFIIKGGYQYITSQFDPEGTKKAKDNILNALIGLVIAVLSSAIVNFVGNTLK